MRDEFKKLRVFASKDDLRPSMKGLHELYGYVYATDAVVLVRKKGKLQPCESISRMVKFKHLRATLPMFDTTSLLMIKVDAKRRRAELIEKLGRPKRTYNQERFLVRIHGAVFDWWYIWRVLNVFKGEARIYKDPKKHHIVIKDKEYQLILMSVRTSDNESAIDI